MLPVVKDAIIDGMIASANSPGYKSDDIYNEIFENNRVLFDIIALAMSTEEFSDEFKFGYLRGACQIYKLLATQAECDELDAMNF